MQPFFSLRPLLVATLLTSLAALAGCAAGQATSPPATARPIPTATTRPIPTLRPTAAQTVPPPTAAPEQPSDSGWIAGSAGIALRQLRIYPAGQTTLAPIAIVRLDPGRVALRVAYAPEQPQLLGGWFADRGPLLAINGGFFTEANQTAALLISDGAAFGQSYSGFGGMLGIGPDGTLTLHALRDQPYDSSVSYAQAIQSFPMLVLPGGTPATIEDDGARARRTVIAQDRDGLLLLLVCPTSSFSLNELASWLATSDLAIDRALNLDGGGSTGLYLNAGAAQLRVEAFTPLPIVLLGYEAVPEAGGRARG